MEGLYINDWSASTERDGQSAGQSYKGFIWRCQEPTWERLAAASSQSFFATSAMRGLGEERAHLGDVAGNGADVVLEDGHRGVRLTSIHFQFESVWPVTKRADQA